MPTPRQRRGPFSPSGSCNLGDLVVRAPDRSDSATPLRRYELAVGRRLSSNIPGMAVENSLCAFGVFAALEFAALPAAVADSVASSSCRQKPASTTCLRAASQIADAGLRPHDDVRIAEEPIIRTLGITRQGVESITPGLGKTLRVSRQFQVRLPYHCDEIISSVCHSRYRV